jgi:hypothetical protein
MLFTGGGADVTRGAQWASQLRDSGRPARVKIKGLFLEFISFITKHSFMML